MIYFKVLKYPFFIFEVNLKYFVGGSKRYLASNFNIDFLSLKKCRLCRKRILSDELETHKTANFFLDTIVSALFT